MDTLSKTEINKIIASSEIIKKYSESIDRESAYEILTAKIEDAYQDSKEQTSRRGRRRQEKSTFEEIFESTTTRQIGRTVARELTRGLLGVLGVKSTRRRSDANTVA